ncbi:unnamed protein product [Gordionus sp. m RMFG-2023]
MKHIDIPILYNAKFNRKLKLNIDKNSTVGQNVLDYVGQKLELSEKDYFGLRFMENNKQRHWLHPIKLLVRQFKNVSPYVLCFRVRFYPPHPDLLQEDIAKYYLFSQLRRDMLHGRLFTHNDDGPLLAAYILQSELGDFDPEEMSANYVSHHRLLMKQTPKIEEKIANFHKTLRGQVPSVAELYFLKKASQLETYGVDPYPVKDQKGNHMYLGINHSGIMTFQNNNKVHHFKWNEIRKIEFDGKMLVIHLLIDEKKHVVGFKCPTQSSCKHIWKCAIEHRDFFQLKSSRDIKPHHSGGSLFARGSKYRYSGRVEREILNDTSILTPGKASHHVMRKSSLRDFPRKKGGTYFSDKAKPVTYHSPKIQHSNNITHNVSKVSRNSLINNSPKDPNDSSLMDKGSSTNWMPTSRTPPGVIQPPLGEDSNNIHFTVADGLTATPPRPSAAPTNYSPQKLPAYSPSQSSQREVLNATRIRYSGTNGKLTSPPRPPPPITTFPSSHDTSLDSNKNISFESNDGVDDSSSFYDKNPVFRSYLLTSSPLSGKSPANKFRDSPMPNDYGSEPKYHEKLVNLHPSSLVEDSVGGDFYKTVLSNRSGIGGSGDDTKDTFANDRRENGYPERPLTTPPKNTFGAIGVEKLNDQIYVEDKEYSLLTKQHECNGDALLTRANMEIHKLQSEKINHLSGPDSKLNLTNRSIAQSPSPGLVNRSKFFSSKSANGGINIFFDKLFLRNRFSGKKVRNVSFEESNDSKNLHGKKSSRPNKVSKPAPFSNDPGTFSKLVLVILLLALLFLAFVLLMESSNPNALYLYKKYPQLRRFKHENYGTLKRHFLKTWQSICDLRR